MSCCVRQAVALGNIAGEFHYDGLWTGAQHLSLFLQEQDTRDLHIGWFLNNPGMAIHFNYDTTDENIREIIRDVILSASGQINLKAGGSPFFIALVAALGFFLYAMRPVLQAWAVEATPRDLAGSGVGLQFGIQHIGASIAPALFGMIADASDLYTAFYFLAGTILFANVLIVFMPNGETAQAKPAAA